MYLKIHLNVFFFCAESTTHSLTTSTESWSSSITYSRVTGYTPLATTVKMGMDSTSTDVPNLLLTTTLTDVATSHETLPPTSKSPIGICQFYICILSYTTQLQSYIKQCHTML